MEPTYSMVLRKFVYPITQKLQGRPLVEYLTAAAKNQYLPAEEMRKLQFRKLISLIKHAYSTVPFYKEKYNSVGVTPDDIRTWADFSDLLPQVTKDDIRECPERFLSSAPNTRVSPVRTGGSTGEPMLFYMDQTSIAAAHACRIRALAWWGVEFGTREIRFWGHSASFAPGMGGWVAKHLIGPVKDRVMNRRTISAYDMSPRHMERHWDIIAGFQPSYIFGYASTLYVYAKFMRERGYRLPRGGLKAAVSCAEILYDWQRKEIEEVFGCPVANEYGASEIGVIAYGCPCGKLHTMDDHLVVELDRAGSVMENAGNIVVTHLSNWGCPLIRYNTLDIGTLSGTEGRCNLGLGFGSLETIIGRQHDMIKTLDGGFVHGEFFTHVFDYLKNVEQFQIIQKAVDRFELLLVMRRPSVSLSTRDQKTLQKRIRERIGNVRLEFKYVSGLDKETSAKFRWIRSEISG